MSKQQSKITGYHAHIYYDPGTKETAGRVREGLGDRFEVLLGRWHDVPVGPAPQGHVSSSLRPRTNLPRSSRG